MSQKSNEVSVSVRVSFIELYREQLFDLLSTQSQRKEDCICDLREDPVKGVVIPNLTLIEVNSLGSDDGRAEERIHETRNCCDRYLSILVRSV